MIKLNSIILIVTVILFGTHIVFADSDGVWHNAKDIRGGVIASDEKVDTTSFTFINNVFINSTLELFKNAGSLNLVGLDHTYIQFFPDGKSSGRKAWFGFGDGLSNDLSIQSESGYLLLNPNTENVGIGTSTPSTKLEILGTTTSTDFECFNCIDEEDLSQNQIDDSEIQDNSLTSLSLAPNSVGGSELIPIYESGSVYNSRFVNVGEINSISSSMVVDNSITSTDLGVNSVGSSELIESDSYTLNNLYVNGVISSSGNLVINLN